MSKFNKCLSVYLIKNFKWLLARFGNSKTCNFQEPAFVLNMFKYRNDPKFSDR